MPMERRGSPTDSAASSSSRSSRRRRKYGRASSGFSLKGAIVIRPSTVRRGHASRMWRIVDSTSSGFRPLLDFSPETLTSRRTCGRAPISSAIALMRSASFTESTEWMKSKSSSAGRTLLPWRWPIKCQLGPDTLAGFFQAASCTLFSPTIERPFSQASRTTSSPWVLVTATISTSSGWRPARAHAAAMRDFTSARISASGCIFSEPD